MCVRTDKNMSSANSFQNTLFFFSFVVCFFFVGFCFSLPCVGRTQGQVELVIIYSCLRCGCDDLKVVDTLAFKVGDSSKLRSLIMKS